MVQQGESQADSATLFGRRAEGKWGSPRMPFPPAASVEVQGVTSAHWLQLQHPITPRSLSEQVSVLPKPSPSERHPARCTHGHADSDAAGLTLPVVPRASLKLQLGWVCSEENQNSSSNMFYVVETR